MATELRRASDRDAEAIRSIYNHEVLTSTATLDLVPRTPEEQRIWMSAHSGAYPALVATREGEVVGFSSLSPYRPRPGYSTAVEDSVYVAQSARRQGVGRLLLEGAIEAARAHGFHSIVARISAEQAASIELHLACGFVMVGVEREIGRKFGRFIDVAIVQHLL
ncbi:MAG TPA: GNAT family N-acetyltransferase [Acidimicrobiales bacterium]|nr:GNAT family N-acetyltransferase [Acidimicrobiales bacterium]